MKLICRWYLDNKTRFELRDEFGIVKKWECL